jgi:hypothetical protein
VPPAQQPPPEHTLFGQHAWPAPPHAVHWPFAHEPPLLQVSPFLTQVPRGSQHAPAAVQVLLAQH